MDEKEIQIAAYGLLIKINVLTGWVVPQSEQVVDILTDQFVKKMKESYSTVNSEEVEYAFRTYGHSVKDWGKQMNLSLIDEVMIPYLEKRDEVSKVEEHAKKPAMIEQKEDLNDVTMQSWYDDVAEKLVNEKVSVAFLPPMLYDWLDAKGKISLTVEKKKAYINEAVRRERETLITKVMQDRSLHKELRAFEEALLTGYTPAMKNQAKRFALNDHILKEHYESQKSRQ